MAVSGDLDKEGGEFTTLAAPEHCRAEVQKAAFEIVFAGVGNNLQAFDDFMTSIKPDNLTVVILAPIQQLLTVTFPNGAGVSLEQLTEATEAVSSKKYMFHKTFSALDIGIAVLGRAGAVATQRQQGNLLHTMDP